MVDAAAAMRLLVNCQPGVIDEAEIRSVFGEIASPSLSSLAQAFGVAAATARNSWRRDGMPVQDAKRGRGCKAVWADALIWLLQRNRRNAPSSAKNGHSERDAVELESAKAMLQIRQARARRELGEYAPLAVLQTVVGALANRTRDAFEELPRKYETTWPRRYANQFREDMERDIRRILTMVSETPLNQVIEYCQRVDAEKGRVSDANVIA